MDYNFEDLIEYSIENSSRVFSDESFNSEEQPESTSKYDEFDLHEKGCNCQSCLDSMSEKMTLKYTSTGLGDVGSVLMNQLGNKEYDVDLKFVDSIDTYDPNGNEITDHIIQIQGRDAKKMTRSLAEKGWRKFSALEFGLLQTFMDDKCLVPGKLIDASQILATSPSVRIMVGKEHFYVKLKDIIEHEVRKYKD